jgi:hypothetical protein
VYPSLTEGEVVRVGQVRGTRQIALQQQCQYLYGSDLGQALYEAVLAHGLLGLRQHGGRAGHVSPGQSQAGQEHFTDNVSINRAIVLPRPSKALLPVLLGSLQVVPFVADAGQADELLISIRR